MGMFDTMLCRLPLPDGLVADEFQTKSLHCALSTYEIGADGRLRELAYTAQRNNPSEARRDTGFHGVLRFYTLAGKDLRQYEAKFTDGSLNTLRTAGEALYDERGLLRRQEQ
jgi:hypothetical protein